MTNEIKLQEPAAEKTIGRLKITGYVGDRAPIFGDLDPKLLERTFVLAEGKNKFAKYWPSYRRKLDSLIKKFVHHEVGEKEGVATLQGNALGAVRSNATMGTNYLVIFDFDSGCPPETIAEVIERRGWFGIIYSTHSQGKNTSTISGKTLKKRFGVEGDAVTGDHVKTYLQEEKLMAPALLDGLTFTTRRNEKGVYVTATHAPLDRFRLVLVLDKPFVFAEREGGGDAGRKLWSAKYKALALQLGADTTDKSCTDPCRLFYLPRRPADRDDHYALVIAGEPVDFEAIEPLPDARQRKRDEAAASGERAPAKEWRSDPDLGRFLWEVRRNFDIVRFCEAYQENPRSNGSKLTTLCPNEESHSDYPNPDDAGFWCINSEDSEKQESFIARCSHNSCSDLTSFDMVDLISAREGLKIEDLTEYVYPEVGHPCPADVVKDIRARSRKAGDEDDASTDEGPAADESGGEKARLAAPFKRQGRKIVKVVGDGDDRKEYDICGDFDVIGLTHDERGAGFGKLISFNSPTGQTVELTIAARRLHDDAAGVRAELVDAGLWVSVARRSDFDELLSLVSSSRVVVTASAPGWHDARRVFVAPTGDVVCGGGGDGDPVPRGAGVGAGDVGDAVPCVDGAGATGWRLGANVGAVDRATRGDFEAWRDAASEFATSGDHFALGLAAGFAGAVTQLCDFESSGFIISGTSSRGKTTAQQIAASVWGNPRAGQSVLHSMKATANAIENLASRSTGSVLCLDELRNLPPRELGALIMGLAGGAGKARQSKSGELRKSAAWSTFYVLSSEKTARTIIESAGDSYLAGFSVRLVDVSVDDASTIEADKFKALSRVIKDNYGHGGVRFVRHLLDSGVADDPTQISDRVHRAAATVAGEDGKRSDVMLRAARVFGLLVVSSYLAEDAGVITEDARAAVEDATMNAWARFAASGEAAAADPIAEAVDSLVEYLASNCRGGGVVDLYNVGARTFREAVAWFDPDLVYVRADKLAEMTGGKCSARALVARLDQLGAIHRVAPDRLECRYVPGVGNVKTYALHSLVIGFEAPTQPLDNRGEH